MKRGVAFCALVFLLAIALSTVFAEFLAPYRFDSEIREWSYAPPTRLHFLDERGLFSIRPFMYAPQLELDPDHRKVFREDRSRKIPIQFFVKGEPYRLFGLVDYDRHLFGVASPHRIYLLGADSRGRDLFSRILYGARISLSIGLVGVFLATFLALVIGGCAGFFRKAADPILMRLAEFTMMLPGFYLLLALRSALPLQLDSRVVYFLIVCVLSLIGWGGLARTIRGMVLSIREEDFVQAATVLGRSNTHILARHILPHTWPFVIVIMSISIPGYILAESALSLIGLGIQDPYASWGSLLSEAMSISQLSFHPWVLWPGVVIFVTVLCFNTIGDTLRDRLDPKRQAEQ